MADTAQASNGDTGITNKFKTMDPNSRAWETHMETLLALHNDIEAAAEAADEGEDVEAAEERNAMIFSLLQQHPWTKQSGSERTYAVTRSDGTEEEWTVSHVNSSVRPPSMKKYVKAMASAAGEKLAKEYGNPNDDMTYSCAFDDTSAFLSMLLRRYQSRGFTYFEFQTPTKTVKRVIRGLNKFTGLTAADEDERSDAPSSKDLFFAGGVSYTDSDTLFISTKSNGENAKATVRLIDDVWWVLAGSKNTCIACPMGEDVRSVCPDVGKTVPSPRIMHKFYDWCTALENEGRFDEFATLMDTNQYTILFEFNAAEHEHVFPIPTDYMDGFAIRSNRGMAIHPERTFEIFEDFGFPHVEYSTRPSADIDDVVAEVRSRDDVEGVVVYFLLEGDVIGALKIKSDFYTLVRATRQIFWQVVNAQLRLVSDYEKKGGSRPRLNVDNESLGKAKRKVKTRMKRMEQLPEVETMHTQWSAVAIEFIAWWVENFNNLSTYGAKEAALHTAKDKYGTIYRQFLDQR